MNSKDEKNLRQFAVIIRKDVLRMISRAGSSHIGSTFSSIEILTSLYTGVMNVRPNEPEWSDRDLFVFSKGHACAGLYAILARSGFFPVKRLDEFYINGGSLPGHATHKNVPGVDISTGALGHGLALGVGLAAGRKRLGKNSRIFVLMSDGECDEGSTWEASLLAPRLSLENLIAIIDYNKIQAYGRVEDIIPLEPFADKWHSFGWDVVEVDGHDFKQLQSAFDRKKLSGSDRKPLCIIAHTIKGKGVSFMEDTLLWHYRCPRDEEYDRALAELEASE